MNKVTLVCVCVSCVVCLVIGLVVGYGYAVKEIYTPVSGQFNAVGAP